MRYLSYVCVSSTSNHIREICITEMLARTIKNIINTSLSNMILDNEKQHNELIKQLKENNKLIKEKEKLNDD